MRLSRYGIALVLLVLPACAEDPKPAPVMPVHVAARAPAAEEPTGTATTSSATMKKNEATEATCSGAELVKNLTACVASPAFIKKICTGGYPESALGLFAKGTPWTRVWMAGDVDAWDASGGMTHPTKVFFDEEIIVLGRHAAPSAGGIVMTGGSASYDVLRSNGACVSVMDGEITTKRPPAPRSASLPWHRMEEPTKRALLESAKVKTTLEAVDKACKGDKATACDKADRLFGAAVLDYIRGGAELPAPGREP